jgi:prepilin-type N-terminal cleavage/methylation domain-containing protein
MYLLCSPSNHSYEHERTSARGFGLIELLVAISVMAIVSAIIIARHDNFNSAVLLRSQVYELALRTREVQLSAVSAIGASGQFRNQYGVLFSAGTSSRNSYIPFRDTNDDGFFSSATEQFGQIGRIDSRFQIRAVRFIGSTESTASGVAVIFERPNFDARFFNRANNEVDASAVEVDVARVGQTGTGPNVLRTLVITSTGQITVR